MDSARRHARRCPKDPRRPEFQWIDASDNTRKLRGQRLLQLRLDALALRFGPSAGPWTRVADRRTFPLTLEFATRVVGARTVLLGNAAQALHPVAGQGFNLGVRDAYELAQELLSIPAATDRDHFGAPAFLGAYSRRRSADRWSGIAFTHGLLGLFGADVSLLRWPRGLALTILDALPPLKRLFARAMLYGLH